MNSPASDRRAFLKNAFRLCLLGGLGALAAGLVLRPTGRCAGDCAYCGRLETCGLPRARSRRGMRTR
jgi:pyruvate formate-lyase activating enzyme-like uncharacterized protein